MTFTPAQLAERRKYLGASESSAALGLSPWFSPVELFLDKIGQGAPIEETIPMMVGTALEPVTLALFERETGLVADLRQQVFVDENCPWRRCTVDGYTSDDWIVEAKSSGDFRGWGDADDEIPQHYLYNAMHSLKCIPQAKGVYFPVLLGGRSFELYRVKRDDEMVDLVCKGEELFMERVRNHTPPEPKSVDDVKLLYPRDNGQSIFASAQIEADAIAIAHYKAEMKSSQEAIDNLMTRVTAFMGANATLRRVTLTGAQGATLATWNTVERNTIDSAKLRQIHPRIAEECTKTSVGRTYLNKYKVTP